MIALKLRGNTVKIRHACYPRNDIRAASQEETSGSFNFFLNLIRDILSN